MSPYTTAAIPILCSGMVFSIIGMAQNSVAFLAVGVAMLAVGAPLLLVGILRRYSKRR